MKASDNENIAVAIIDNSQNNLNILQQQQLTPPQQQQQQIDASPFPQQQTSSSQINQVASASTGNKPTISSLNRNNRSTELYFQNGKLRPNAKANYETYYAHNEKTPLHYHPLVQYLDETELKYHNDNVYHDTSLGFPTKAQVLRERMYHLPLLKDTPAEKARYKRKLFEKQRNITLAHKKFDFKTNDGYNSHYFLTGARFNRTDTIDSKILSKYGIFINKHNPELVYFKPRTNSMMDFHTSENSTSEQLNRKGKNKMYTSIDETDLKFKSKSIQVPQLTKDMELTEKRFSSSLAFI